MAIWEIHCPAVLIYREALLHSTLKWSANDEGVILITILFYFQPREHIGLRQGYYLLCLHIYVCRWWLKGLVILSRSSWYLHSNFHCHCLHVVNLYFVTPSHLFLLLRSFFLSFPSLSITSSLSLCLSSPLSVFLHSLVFTLTLHQSMFSALP